MPDSFGRQAYLPDYDPAPTIAEAKATIARNRAQAKARAEAHRTETATDDLEDTAHAT